MRLSFSPKQRRRPAPGLVSWGGTWRWAVVAAALAAGLSVGALLAGLSWLAGWSVRSSVSGRSWWTGLSWLTAVAVVSWLTRLSWWSWRSGWSWRAGNLVDLKPIIIFKFYVKKCSNLILNLLLAYKILLNKVLLNTKIFIFFAFNKSGRCKFVTFF